MTENKIRTDLEEVLNKLGDKNAIEDFAINKKGHLKIVKKK